MDSLINLLPFDTIKNLLITDKIISKFVDGYIGFHKSNPSNINAIYDSLFAYDITSIGIMKYMAPFLQKVHDEFQTNTRKYDAICVFINFLFGACSNNNSTMVDELLNFCENNGIDKSYIRCNIMKQNVNRCFNRCICNGNIEIIEHVNKYFKCFHLVDDLLFVDVCKQGNLNIIKSVTEYMVRTNYEYKIIISRCFGYVQNIETAEFLINFGYINIYAFTNTFWGSNPLDSGSQKDKLGIRIWRMLIDRAKLNPSSSALQNDSNGDMALIRYSKTDFFCSLLIAHDCENIKIVSELLTNIFETHKTPIEYINSCTHMDELFEDVCKSCDILLMRLILEADSSNLAEKLRIIKSIGGQQFSRELFRNICQSKNILLIKLILETDQNNLIEKIVIAKSTNVYDILFENICISGNCSLIRSILKKDCNDFEKKLYIIKSVNNEQLLNIFFENICTFGNSSFVSLMLDADRNNIDKKLSIAKSIGGKCLLDDLFKNACISENEYLIKSMMLIDYSDTEKRLSIAKSSDNQKIITFLGNIVK